MDKKDQLKNKIETSDLNEEDKEFWDSLLVSSPADLIGGIYDMLIQFPAELLWLTRIYQRKKQAFAALKENKAEGQKLLSEIYKEEREKLEEILV